MKKIIFLFSISLLFISVASAQSVDILYQGDGYTPAFYKGRTLWSSQSQITLFAVPQGLGNPNSLNYKWTQNGTVRGSYSGVGKNTFAFNDSVLSKPQTIGVEVVNADGDTLASSSTTITPEPPSVLVYEDNPLYGLLFNKEVSGTYRLSEPEVSFSAFPLFFSAKNRADSALNYSWHTTGGAGESSNSVTYRAPENSSGSSEISVSVSHKDKLIQSGGKSFLVQFGK